MVIYCVTQEVNDDLAKIKKTVNGEKVLPGQPIMLTGGVLRDYQIDGYNWLKVTVVIVLENMMITRVVFIKMRIQFFLKLKLIAMFLVVFTLPRYVC